LSGRINRNGNWDIYAYDMNVKKEKVICAAAGNQTEPRIKREGSSGPMTGAEQRYLPLRKLYGMKGSLRLPNASFFWCKIMFVQIYANKHDAAKNALSKTKEISKI